MRIICILYLIRNYEDLACILLACKDRASFGWL